MDIFIDFESLKLALGLLADDLKELDLEDEGGVGADITTSTARAISEIRGDIKLELVANTHQLQSLSPAADNLSNTEGKGRVALVRGVEFLAVDESTSVVDLDTIRTSGSDIRVALVDNLVKKTGTVWRQK